MNLSQSLSRELEKILQGDPWHGSPVYAILEQVTFETAFEKPPGSVHDIAGIVLHMLSWTEEVLDRMNGMSAGMPSSGDWPDPGTPTEEKWQNYVNDLKLVNVNLLAAVRDFPDDQWNEPYKDERNRELGAGVNFEELVRGLIQHDVYHSGQIAILTRIING